MEPNIFLGARLRAVRQHRHLTIAQLAQACNVGERAVSQWETGRRLPGANYLGRLAAALNCDIEAFFAPAEEVAS